MTRIVLAALVAVGCGMREQPREEREQPRAEPVLESEPSARADPAQEERAHPPSEARGQQQRRTLDDATRTRLRTAIRDGRRAARDGRFADAVAAFESAVEIDPASARVRCEAAFVAFQNGELARADAHVRIALAATPPSDRVDDELRVPTAMCLYNAGLIHEARDRLPEAREAFRRSLALRPNETVRGRLADVERRMDPMDVDEDDGALSFPLATSFDDIARSLRDELCATGGGGFSPGYVACDDIQVRIERAGESTGIEAAAISLSVQVPAGGEQLETALAVRGAGALLVGRTAEGYSPGIAGMSASCQLTLELRDVLPGGSPELLATHMGEAHDSDMGTCDERGYYQGGRIACSIDDGTLRCIALPTSSVSFEDHTPCNDTWDADGDDDYDEELAGDEAVHTEEGYSLVLTLESGRAVFARRPDSRATGVPPLIGERTILDLLRRSDLAWPGTMRPVELVAG